MRECLLAKEEPWPGQTRQGMTAQREQEGDLPGYKTLLQREDF